jgi:hypothetical protein
VSVANYHEKHRNDEIIRTSLAVKVLNFTIYNENAMLRHPGETGRSVFVCLAVFLGIIPPSKVDDRNSGEVAEWLTKAPRSGALNAGACDGGPKGEGRSPE